MCNKCDCDHSDQCSIVGYLSYGACCAMCVHYDEAHTCPSYQMVTQNLTVSKSELFPMVSKKKSRAIAYSIERFP